MVGTRGSFALPNTDEEDIDFPLLGDLHVDGREHHNFEWLEEEHAGDIMDWVEQASLGAPLAFCKGNHDVTGPGALEVYDQSFAPWLSCQLGEVSSAAFTRSAGGTLIVFFDAYAKGKPCMVRAFDG